MRSKSRAFSAARAAKSANTATLVTSAGPKAWPSPVRVSTSTDCSSPIATSGAATIEVGRRWRLSASVWPSPGPAARAWLRAASATSDSAASMCTARSDIGPSATPRAAAGRRRTPSASSVSITTASGENSAWACSAVRSSTRDACRLETAPRLSTSASRNAACDTSSPRSFRLHCSDARSRSVSRRTARTASDAEHGDDDEARQERGEG